MMAFGPDRDFEGAFGGPANSAQPGADREQKALSDLSLSRLRTPATGVFPASGGEVAIIRRENNNLGEINRDFACMEALASALHPRLKTLQIGAVESRLGIVIDEPDPSSFLSARIANRELIRDRELVKLAQLIAHFHFLPAACPIAQANLGELLRDRVMEQTQREVLTQITEAGEDTSHASDWFSVMERMLQRSKDQISVAATALNEPIVAHCDIVPEHVVVLASGEVAIVDLDLSSSDASRTRRTDAGRFYIELKLLGRDSEANKFWTAYERRYNHFLADRGQSFPKDSDVARGIRAIDSAALFVGYCDGLLRATKSKQAGPALRAANLIDSLMAEVER
jgi:hypothetical protein